MLRPEEACRSARYFDILSSRVTTNIIAFSLITECNLTFTTIAGVSLEENSSSDRAQKDGTRLK